MNITSNDIKALRTCDDVVFRFVDGECFIKALGRTNPNNYFETGSTVVRCKMYVDIYDRSDEYHPRYLVSAFEMVHSCKADPIWTTIANLLRKGDLLTLHWQAGAWTTEKSRSAGFFGDTVTLIVERNGKKMHFRVGTSFSENNSARMCQISYS